MVDTQPSDGPGILLRCDGGSVVGHGHVMRSLALAQACRADGWDVAFAMAQSDDALQGRLQAQGLPVLRVVAPRGSSRDARQTVGLARERRAAWVAVDGYCFGAAYQQVFKSEAVRVLAVDDVGGESYHADVLLNQNIHAHARLYGRQDPGVRLLLGTRYALLRNEFRKWRDWHRQVQPRARRVLVTLGGVDPDNATLKVIQALESLPGKDLEVVVVVGGSNPHYDSLCSLARVRSHFRINRDPADLPDWMAWADVAVCAGGSTSWELALLRLPSLVMTLAANQRPVAEGLDAAGVAIHLGWHGDVTAPAIAHALQELLPDAARRAEMSRRARKLVDGWGADRVLTVLRDVQAPLSLRRACADDCRLYFEWANEPGVRASAFHQEPIPWETHLTWFNRRLADPASRLFIALNGQDRPVGQIRFDLHGGRAETDVSLDRRWRGRGYGPLLILRGIAELTQAEDVREVDALIRPENQASVRSFLKAGFVEEDGPADSPPRAVHLRWRPHA